MHPLYSIPLFLTSALCLAMGLFVFWNKPRERLNQVFCLLAISVAQWSFFYGFIYCARDPIKVVWLARCGFYGIVLIPTFFVHFMLLFLHDPSRWIRRLIYLLASIFWVANSLPSTRNGIYHGTHEFFFGLYPLAGGWTYGSF